MVILFPSYYHLLFFGLLHLLLLPYLPPATFFLIIIVISVIISIITIITIIRKVWLGLQDAVIVSLQSLPVFYIAFYAY